MQLFLTFIAVFITAVSEVVDTVVFKKVSEIAIKYNTPKIVLLFIDYGVLFSFVFIPLSFFSLGQSIWNEYFNIISDIKFLLLLLGIIIARIVVINFWTIAYANEKISVLTPYAQVSSILGIIFGFFLFPNITSNTTFIFAITASIILWFSNLDGGKFQFNKYCLLLLISEFAQTIYLLLVAKLVVMFSPLSVAFSTIFSSFILIGLFLIIKRSSINLPTLIEDKKVFWKNDGISNISWIVNTFICFTLFKEVGVTLTILLSMTVLIISFIASYIFYKDIPTKKDVFVSILIVTCISLGYYFN